jgi:DNA (cytosine-5)-methyltransferase 1
LKYYYLDLFSGIGGFALGAYWAWMKFHEHYFSEVDNFATETYRKRFPDAIPLGDVRKIRGGDLPKGQWLLTGGFPCQDISVAGNKAGLEGERSGLFSEYIRLIGEIRPRFAIMENVGNLAAWFDAGEGRLTPDTDPIDGTEWTMELDQYQAIARCEGCLSEIGYDSEWAAIRASDVGAPHKRDRIWIVAYPDNGRIQERWGSSNTCANVQGQVGIRTDEPSSSAKQKRETLAYPEGEGLPQRGQSGITQGETENDGGMVPGSERCGENVPDSGCLRLETPGAEQQTTGPFGCGEELSDTHVLHDDHSGHGTSPVCGERSPEAEISRGDPDPDRERREELLDRITAWARDPNGPSCRNGIGNFWAVEPRVGRVANGIPFRVDRLKGLGNSVVPQIPQLILEEIKENFYSD